MNEKQKKLTLVFLFISCAILLTITGIITFAVYQTQVAQQGDIFDKIVAKQHMTWISPSVVHLMGVIVTAIVVFIGLSKIYKSPKSPQTK